ncbi:hypothetical protein HHK36_027222 [Tetracentron sinense]|uniref:Uncharacterized protein n=1 Tax=Tetracentron sinense TaxID=13715 RepID=A0A835D5C2_TETSI|nr:hypothetical protein HHK36_027222 [Tetracentron sinense]
MGSNSNERVTLTKPFSIREYVLGSRQKDICHNWPFPEEYLQVCMKYGISRVLPPFARRYSVEHPSHRKDVDLSCAQEKKEHVGSIRKNCVGTEEEKEITKLGSNAFISEAVSEISKQVHLLSASANSYECGEENDLLSDIVPNPMMTKFHCSITKPCLKNPVDQSVAALPSTKRLRKKRKTRKGKPKKRSMGDIYAEARPCTLEDLYRINGTIRTIDFIEGQEKSDNVGQSCISKLTKGFWKKKHPRDGNAANKNLMGKTGRIKKLKDVNPNHGTESELF